MWDSAVWKCFDSFGLIVQVESPWPESNDVVGERLTVPAVLVALGRMADARRYDRQRNNKRVGALRGFAFSIVNRIARRPRHDLTGGA